MDNALRLRALYTVGIHMTHNVMAHFLLARFCHVVVDISRMAFQLIDLLLCDRKSEFLFCLCQRNPESSPGLELHILRRNELHFAACIPFR